MAKITSRGISYQLLVRVSDVFSLFEQARLWREKDFSHLLYDGNDTVLMSETVHRARANKEHHLGDLLCSVLVVSLDSPLFVSSRSAAQGGRLSREISNLII